MTGPRSLAVQHYGDTTAAAAVVLTVGMIWMLAAEHGFCMLDNDRRSTPMFCQDSSHHCDLHSVPVTFDMVTSRGPSEVTDEAYQQGHAPLVTIHAALLYVVSRFLKGWKCLESLTCQSPFPGMFLAIISTQQYYWRPPKCTYRLWTPMIQ